MSEPTLIDKRTRRPFRTFEARPTWMGDEDFSGHLTADQLEAIRKFNERERKPLTVPFNRARLWQVGLLIFIVATVLLITLVNL